MKAENYVSKSYLKHCIVLRISKEGGGQKYFPLLCEQLNVRGGNFFTSIKPPDVVGPGAFGLFGHNW